MTPRVGGTSTASVIFHEDEIPNNAAMVRADIDELGLLVKNGLIPKDVFLSAYWNTVIISWKALKDNIAEERKRRRYPQYMSFFEELCGEADYYAKKIGVDTDNVKPYYDDDKRLVHAYPRLELLFG